MTVFSVKTELCVEKGDIKALFSTRATGLPFTDTFHYRAASCSRLENLGGEFVLGSMMLEAKERSQCPIRYTVPEAIVLDPVPSKFPGWRPSASFSSGIFLLLLLYCTSGTNEADAAPRSITTTNL